jgi:hypothetical protein
LDALAELAAGCGWEGTIELLRRHVGRYEFEKALEQLRTLPRPSLAAGQAKP